MRQRAEDEVARRAHQATIRDIVAKTRNFGDVTWLGYPIWQNVLDLWALQEAISEIRPAVVLETGTNRGGSALFYGHLMRLLGIDRALSQSMSNVSMTSMSRAWTSFSATACRRRCWIACVQPWRACADRCWWFSTATMHPTTFMRR
jgi:cephalosporin hydroxylase